jgi:hypothetical protein
MKPRHLELLKTYKYINNYFDIHEKNIEYLKYEAKR